MFIKQKPRAARKTRQTLARKFLRNVVRQNLWPREGKISFPVAVIAVRLDRFKNVSKRWRAFSSCFLSSVFLPPLSSSFCPFFYPPLGQMKQPMKRHFLDSLRSAYLVKSREPVSLAGSYCFLAGSRWISVVWMHRRATEPCNNHVHEPRWMGTRMDRSRYSVEGGRGKWIHRAYTRCT